MNKKRRNALRKRRKKNINSPEKKIGGAKKLLPEISAQPKNSFQKLSGKNLIKGNWKYKYKLYKEAEREWLGEGT